MKKGMRLLITLILALFAVVLFADGKEVNVQAEGVKDERELKAVWMSTFTGEAPYYSEAQFKADMTEALNIFDYYGINAVIYHVRTHNNAFYRSNLNPLCSWWSGVNFDVFDPLGWLIAECHKRGIEFHAWMNPYRYSTSFQSGTLPAANPQSDPNNLLEGKILNPAKEVVRQHIYSTITEFATLYPTVDAIHFDDYFYVSTTAAPTGADARRAEVDKLIQGIHNVLTEFNQTNGTSIQFGISPTGIYKNGNGVVTYDANGNPVTTGSSTTGFQHYGDYLYADTLKWAINGWIDYLMPQTYWARNHAAASYTKLLDWWDKAFRYLDCNLYSGIGVYMADTSGTYDWYNNMQEMDAQLLLIDTKADVRGYSIYSYKHLKNGYTNSTANSGVQIRNAYNTAARRAIKVPPEVRTMNPVNIASIKNISYADGILSWDSVHNGKFYYIYQSDGIITYSTDEIVGVIGHQDGRMSYDVSSLNGGNFSVRAISITNHYSPLSAVVPEDHATVTFSLGYNATPPGEQIIQKGNLVQKPTDPIREGYNFLGWYLNEQLFNFNTPVTTDINLVAKWQLLQVYNINYNLNGGTLESMGYETRDEMIVAFLTDFYNYLSLKGIITPDDELTDFMHGYGYTSGYGGWYDDEYYFSHLYEMNNKEVNASTGKFINQPEYNKWVPLLDLMEEYTSTGNPNQVGQFWGMPDVVGILRIKPFIQQRNLWTYLGQTETALITEILNRIPPELEKVPVIYSFTEISPDITLPPARRDGYEFLGWYNNAALTGSPIGVIPSGTTTDVDLYAKWNNINAEELTIYFSLDYAGLSLPAKKVYEGEKVTRPTDPVRSGYTFAGWYLNNILYDFNNPVYNSFTLVARWEEVVNIETVTVTFNLNYGNLPVTEETINKGTVINKPTNPTRLKYQFLGWYLNNVLYNFNTPVNQDITLYAKWEELNIYEEVTLYFDLGYNSLWLPNIVIEKGTTLSEPYSPHRDGYEFLGWLLDHHLFNFNEPIYENKTFVALWKSDGGVKEHTVTFSLGYDNLSLEPVTVLDGSRINVPNKPVREEHVFLGWNCGVMRFDFTEPVYENIDLVAKWNESINVTNMVETLSGASIREVSESGIQRLRFYGRVDSSLLKCEFGFYAIFGEATSEQLLEAIRNNDGSTIYINGRDVKRRAINRADYKNEFSIVLTGIPRYGYADKVTVIAYAIDEEDNLYLASEVATRSVLEVATKMERVGDATLESRKITNYAHNNLYKLYYDVYGNLSITKGIAETNHFALREIFFNDWNNKFGINLVESSALEFFTSAKEGSTVSDNNNTNLAPTNIYKFFNDSIYKTKWEWLLNYLQDYDYTIHAAGQIEAIKGNGTYTNPNLSGSGKNRLWNALHLSYSLYNFFNEAYERGGYTAIDFYNTTPANDGLNKYERYSHVPEYNEKIYIDCGLSPVFKNGDVIKLPDITLTPSVGKMYVYFDGSNYFAPESFYTTSGEKTFTVVEVTISAYPINYYDGVVELVELKDYYIQGEEKELPELRKAGYNFLGWYDNSNLTGSAISKVASSDMGDKTFYAKWEKANAVIKVVYDFGDYGYHTTSKNEIFMSFREDYKEFYNLSAPIGSTIHDFYPNSKLTLPNKIEEIFNDSVMGEKWGWLKDYILLKAEETNYPHLDLLLAYNQELWRLNIQALFVDALYEVDDLDYLSVDFSNLENGNSFWIYTKYNSYVANYTYADSLVLGSAVKVWDHRYEFVGWVNESNETINSINDLSEGEHHLRAIFIKK